MAEQLAKSTGYAVPLALWGKFGPTIVRMIEARQPLLVAMRAGTVMSVLHTATGCAFAAALPNERIAGAIAGALNDAPRHGAGLTVEEEALVLRAREDVRMHGVVRAQRRPIPNVNAFSAPVLDHKGQAVLVITALGHQEEFSVEWDSAAAIAVREAAAEVSRRLGWRANSAG